MHYESFVGTLTEPVSGRSWNREETCRQVAGRIHALQAAGFAPGDRVLIHFGNRLEFFAELLAIWAAGGCAIPVDALADWATVFDCVYVPPETPLLRAARARGLKAANGSEMLIAQAAAAFERWTGVGGMADVMRDAVAPLLADPGSVA